MLDQDQMHHDEQARKRLDDVGKRLRVPLKHWARPVSDASELEEVWRHELASYGEQAQVSWKTFLSCWRSYPSGFLVMRDQAEMILGSVEYFPIRKTTFRAILRGTRREEDISRRSIHRLDDPTPMTYWYLSGITIRGGDRSTMQLADLMSSFIAHLLASMSSDDVTLCALASSSSGERLLRAFGLRKYREGVALQNGWPVYLLKATSAVDIEAALPRFIMSRGHRSMATP